MNYTHITLIGESYSKFGGEEGTSGVRTEKVVWSGVENKLKQAILDLKKAMTTSAAVSVAEGHTGSVKDLAKFHASKNQDNGREAAIAKAKKEVDRLRLWLKMEGASADKDGNVNMGPMANLKVQYDRQLASQGLTKVRFQAGRLFTDDACRNPLDTGKMVSHFSGPGYAIFVMSGNGNLHVSSHVVGHRHHSSLLAGGPVACAGEIVVVNGRVVWLSNKSGHYWPNEDHLIQILHQLQKKNVPLSFELKVFIGTAHKTYGTVGAWLNARMLNDEPDYELNKLLCYSAFLNDATLSSNNWRWRNPDEAPGVYDITNNAPIPHKQVRQWLKSQTHSPALAIQRGNNR